MNYLGSPYHDHIADMVADLLGGSINGHDVLYSKEDFLCVPGCELYSRLMKTTCCLDPFDKNISQITLIGLLLLHYKYITIEQLLDLMPWSSNKFLSRYAAADGKNKKEAALTAHEFGDYAFYYMLSRSEYKRLLSLIPVSYLKDNRIGDSFPIPAGMHAVHQVFTNNTPFRLLRDNAFSPFMWVTSVSFDPELTLEYNLALRKEDSSFGAVNGSRAIYPKKPDGIIITETSDGKYYCLVEQDMGTERKAALDDKHRFYGNIFTREKLCDNITVLYNSANPSVVRRIKCRAPDHERRETYPRSLSRLKFFMNQRHLVSISEAWFFLMAEGAKEGSGLSRNELLPLKGMMDLLSDYMAARPDRPSNDGTIRDVEEFVSERLNEKEYSRDENIYRQEKRRADTMRNNAIDFIVSDKGWELRSAIQDKGLSYIVANRIAFDRYAPALLAKESGYAVQLFTRIAGTSLFSYKKTFRFSKRDGDINGIRFRNAFKLSDGLPVTVFEEISNDIGGYLRAAYFSSRYKGKGAAMNLILLVSGEDDARSFTKNTEISRFITADPDFANWELNVHVAFVDYSNKGSLPFIITPDGEKKELSKNKNTKEVI